MPLHTHPPYLLQMDLIKHATVSRGVGGNIDVTTDDELVEYRAVYTYEAHATDEVSMACGDRIGVRRFFADGWGVGINRESGAVGMIPIESMCEAVD